MEEKGMNGQSSAYGSRFSILLVDDDSDVIRIIHKVLSNEGHDGETAKGGREAIDLLARGHHFDLVTIDIGCRKWMDWDDWSRPAGADGAFRS